MAPKVDVNAGKECFLVFSSEKWAAFVLPKGWDNPFSKTQR